MRPRLTVDCGNFDYCVGMVEAEVAVVVEAVSGAVVDASSFGMIEGAAAGSMRTVRVVVAVRPSWSVAT